MEKHTIVTLAKHIGVGESTLSKWVTEMKIQGYPFKLHEEGQKQFFDEEDALYLSRIAELKRQEMKLKTSEAVEIALTEDRAIAAAVEEGFHVETLILPQENPLEKDYTLFNLMQGRYNYLDEKLDNFQKQQDRIEQYHMEEKVRNERRDHHLIDVMRGMQKNNKELLQMRKLIKRTALIGTLLIVAAVIVIKLF